MSQFHGLDEPFQLLFSDEECQSASLPEPLRRIYPGDWHVPVLEDRPYVYSNFVTSRDGRVSYNTPGFAGGGPISQGSAHDRWLMALLRMRAHAVLVGDVTLEIEPDHDWTSEFIYPEAADAFTSSRKAEGYAPKPLLVLLSFDGRLNFEADCFENVGLHIVIATTGAGVSNIGNRRFKTSVDVLDLGEVAVDLSRLVDVLFAEYGVRNLLCEGGARVFANMLDAHLIDEEFVTLSPAFVGRSPESFRPSYTEGVAWLPLSAPYSKPFSLHRAGDLLYLRTRCQYP